MRKAKKMSNNKLISNSKDKYKTTWPTFNFYTNSDKKTTNVIELINPLENNSEELANEVNDFFFINTVKIQIVI